MPMYYLYIIHICFLADTYSLGAHHTTGGERDGSFDNFTRILDTTVDGSLEIDNDDGEDLVELEEVDISGPTKISTGDDDDLIRILDSVFGELVEIDGGDDDDTFFDDGLSTFGGGLDLDDIETVLP